MILANLRARFVPSDTHVVLELLAPLAADGDDEPSERLRQEGFEALLDTPGMADRMCDPAWSGSPSPALFTYVVVRHALLSVGVDNVRLSDYLGAMLLEFGHSQRAYRIARYDDETYRYLTDIVASLQTQSGKRGLLLRAHLGNYSLWLSGIFPEYIAARRQRSGGPSLTYFEQLGARGFQLASDHHLARDLDMADVYGQAAEAFRVLRVALNRVSDRLMFPRSDSVARLLRQVADGYQLEA